MPLYDKLDLFTEKVRLSLFWCSSVQRNISLKRLDIIDFRLYDTGNKDVFSQLVAKYILFQHEWQWKTDDIVTRVETNIFCSRFQNYIVTCSKNNPIAIKPIHTINPHNTRCRNSSHSSGIYICMYISNTINHYYKLKHQHKQLLYMPKNWKKIKIGYETKIALSYERRIVWIFF